ncbi:MAG: bifunctional riboflavin kinase/FAD synthetase [Gammaproteobacteria bacterium]|nr:bifunctional riboflavin kinase/FAD synthetase [Gammaproteobacteria bacterium]MDH5803078.1 bifunctional riboflavin kinase/FAD synthetase [Gammaproteobacteria bacterium]
MELIRGLHNLREQHRHCVATIGNFDGVHLGHQAVIDQCLEKAVQLGLPCVVISFEPQPQEFFRKDQAPPRLTRLREKLQALKPHHLDRVLCLRFDDHLAGLSAAEFVDTVLVQGLDVKYLVVGDDFRFGKDRSGDFAFLQSSGAAAGFEVCNTRSFLRDGERVSSTRIRQALEQGDFMLAQQLLGRPYGMCGRVAHGDKRGRTIGFPTANIYLHRCNTPVLGVYAVLMTGLGGEARQGVANIGNRPTVDGQRTLLEVHLFDFDAEIYGVYVEVLFIQKIRSEQRFESFEALKQQIHKDAVAARAIFAGSEA